MNEFKFACPHCQQHLQCDEQFSGREIQCPHCNTMIRIPPVPGKTADYQPESGKTWNTFIPGGKAPPSPGLSVKKPQKPNEPNAG